MQNGSALPDRLAPKQAANLIAVSVSTLCMWRKKRIGPPWRRSETNRIYYIRGDVEDWLNRYFG